jgi:hypothetical protein
MKIKIFLFTSILLTSCIVGSEPLSSSEVLSQLTSISLSETTHSVTSSTTLTTSQTLSSTTTSTSASSSLTSLASISTAQTLDPIWAAAMGGIVATNFYGVVENLPNSLSSVKITHVVAVYSQDQTLYGYAYEGRVDGNGGPNSIRFRVGLKANTYAAFVNVSNSEHTGFGRVIITALVNQLAGKPASYQQALQIMLTANASASASTETLNGLRPALEAITLHYLAKIA